VVRSGVLGALLLALWQSPAPVDWRTIPVDSYPSDARAQIGPAREAALQSPSDATRVGQLGLVLHAWEQFELAAQAYADARRLAPGDVTWWALSGTLATRMGRHDVAAECYGKAVALSPSPVLALRHADALLDSGRTDEARRAYGVAVAMPDAEPAARYGLGRLAVAAGDMATARVEFERAIALVPTFGAAHYALAQVQRKGGDLAGARASIARQQQCLACWPMPTDSFAVRLSAVRDDAAAQLQRGIASAGRAEDAAAIEFHESALARDPALVQADVNLITLYARTGNMPKAEAHYRAVLERGTQLAEAHHAYGLALLAARDAARAEPILRLAADANPQDAEVHNALGLIEESSARPAEAEQSYGRATAANPRIRGYRFNRARVLVALGRLDEALAALTPLASPDDAESARYVYATAAVYVRKGDLVNGRRLSEEARARALRYGLTDLAAAIDRDLQRLK
jgi:tetratricopeptide (TPR) repeat protein